MRRSTRFGALVFACAFASIVPADAASQLNSIRVTPGANGLTQVNLALSGGVPSGWRISGNGTSNVVIALPGTTPGPGLRPSSFTGANGLQSITFQSNSGELDVSMQMSGPVQVGALASASAINVTIPPPAKTANGPSQPAYAAPRGLTSIGNQNFEVVMLKYADVSEVAGILVEGSQVTPQDVFQQTGSIFGLPTSGSGVVTPLQNQQVLQQTESQPQPFGQKISENIAVDRRLNAIIISGTPQQIADIKALINKIDVPLPSVVLECEVVELSETAAHDLGIDYTNGPGSGVLTATGTVPTGVPGNAISAKLQASLFATIQHGGGEILATPRVLASNGMPAQILTGDALPIISTTIFPGTPTITQQTISYIAVGVNLQIQPRITSDGYVTSHIFAEVSSVTSEVPTNQGNVPQVSLRQATTMATVQNGTPFVIGGLLRDEEITSTSKVPGAGDIPLIGGLFRVRHDTLTKSNLYIIVTPYIVNRAGIPNAPPPALPAPQVPGPVPTSTPLA